MEALLLEYWEFGIIKVLFTLSYFKTIINTQKKQWNKDKKLFYV